MFFFFLYVCFCFFFFFFFSSRRRHTRLVSDWSSDVCSSDLLARRVAVVVKESLRAMARERFERSVRAKIESLGSELTSIEYVADDDDAVEAALGRAAGSADLVMTAGGGSTDPADAFFV